MPDNRVNHPFVMKAQAKKYAWCSCGESSKQPFCDGSHDQTGMYPVIEFIEEEGKTVAWCGCKRTETPPYCDGSHKSISD